MGVIQNRYEFVIFFDVSYGTINNTPDAGSMPRMDPETGHGLATDVSLKRKVRNYVEMTRGDKPGFDIYIKQGIPLNHLDYNVCLKSGLIQGNTKFEDLEKALSTSKVNDPQFAAKIKETACALYYDVRTFGAVMTTFAKSKCGCSQVRGPVQFSFARSVDPIMPQQLSITRMAQATEEAMKEKGENTMGNKWVIPYGLYRMDGYINAALANKLDGPNHTGGFSEEDLEVLWEAILNMFEFDHAAARGKVSLRKLIVFKHDTMYGNAPAQQLFDLVHAERKPGVEVPRDYSDYIVTVDKTSVPSGVTLEEKL